MRAPTSFSFSRAVLLLVELLMLCLATRTVRVSAQQAAEKSLKSSVVLDVRLSVSPKDYIRLFWENEAFYQLYLRQQGDIDISVGAWKPAAGIADGKARERVVITSHPVHSPVRGMGLPSHARSTKHQTLQEVIDENGYSVVLHEVNEVSGVPFSERFYVVVTWKATWPDGRHGRVVHLTVTQHVVIRKAFWLSSTVERSTTAETRATLELWAGLAALEVGGVKGKGTNTACSTVAAPQQSQSSSSSQAPERLGLRGLLTSFWEAMRVRHASSALLLTALTSLFVFNKKRSSSQMC